MRHSIIFGMLLLAASLGSADAGLGESSSPQRARCENQASAKFSMLNWFARRDFVQRCIGTSEKAGRTRKKKVSSR